MIEEPAKHSDLFFALSLAVLLISTVTAVIVYNNVFEKEKLHNLTRSTAMISTIIFGCLIIASSIFSIVEDKEYSKSISNLESQILEDNPEIKTIDFMKGGPIPEIAPTGPSPRYSRIFECYDSSAKAEDTGIVTKTDKINYHATIVRTLVDEDKQICEYTITIVEKVEYQEHSEPLDGLPV